MAEESQMRGHDRLGDRRLNSAGANYLVGDVGGEGNLQNMSKAPLIERIKSNGDLAPIDLNPQKILLQKLDFDYVQISWDLDQ